MELGMKRTDLLDIIEMVLTNAGGAYNNEELSEMVLGHLEDFGFSLSNIKNLEPYGDISLQITFKDED